MQTTNPAWQRRNNLAVLARAVWQNPGSSRRDLDHRFQIDKSSISRLVQVLIDLGLVETSGRSDFPISEAAVAGGRPRVPLRIRAEYGQVWGLALWPDKARLTILNARGDVLSAREERLPSYRGDFERYLDTALDFAAAVAAPLDIPVLGVGFAVPGWVDFDAGRIRESLPFGVENLEPLAGLSARIPVLWENDANCGAWSCQPPGDDVSDALYVFGRSVEGSEKWAVGFGLVIAGRLHRGWRHRAGETFSTVGVPDELLRDLRFVSDFLDPRTIFLGGDLKDRFGEVQESLERIGWNAPADLLRLLPRGVDEVSLGAAQLVLDELFQLPSTHGRSLFMEYGTVKDDRLRRGIPPHQILTFRTSGQ
jgi:hypothetical protein